METKMNTYRKAAISVGVLFIIALIFNIVASAIFDPILNVSDYLTHAYPNKTPVIIGNILNIIAGLAMIFIPIILFPIVKKTNENLALGYIVFRSLEGILFIYMAIKSLTLISLSKAYINEGAQNVLYLQALGNAIHSEIHWATVIDVIIFSLGALAFYYLLYKSKLAPRFLSVWGLLAIPVLFTGIMLGMFSAGIFSSTPLMEGMAYFAPPIALNELVLSIWLIAKGFNSSVITNASYT